MIKTDTQIRQNKLAKWIGINLVDCPKMIPLGGHSSFVAPYSVPLDENYFEKRICDVAWLAPAAALGHMDHAWLFGFNEDPKEPWGFVTEPYLDIEKAHAAVYLASDRVGEWGVDFKVLPNEQSSWNPGSCTPIVGYVRLGCYKEFVCNAMWFLLHGRGLT